MNKALRSLSALVPWSLLPLDGFLAVCQRLAAAVARLVYVRDWQMEARGRPQFFKHQINLSRWSREPQLWAFTARGVFARQLMLRDCSVLDLCCGDGSYSALFFSDIARRIDAVDNDGYALSYARRYHSADPITYHQRDIVRQELPGSGYDVIVWNAAICYFDLNEIDSILRKLIAAGKPEMQLVGMLPRANGWIDHKTEFPDLISLATFLKRYFSVVNLREIDEITAVTFYFQASEPLAPGSSE